MSLLNAYTERGDYGAARLMLQRMVQKLTKYDAGPAFKFAAKVNGNGLFFQCKGSACKAEKKISGSTCENVLIIEISRFTPLAVQASAWLLVAAWYFPRQARAPCIRFKIDDDSVQAFGCIVSNVSDWGAEQALMFDALEKQNQIQQQSTLKAFCDAVTHA